MLLGQTHPLAQATGTFGQQNKLTIQFLPAMLFLMLHCNAVLGSSHFIFFPYYLLPWPGWLFSHAAVSASLISCNSSALAQAGPSCPLNPPLAQSGIRPEKHGLWLCGERVVRC